MAYLAFNESDPSDSGTLCCAGVPMLKGREARCFETTQCRDARIKIADSDRVCFTPVLFLNGCEEVFLVAGQSLHAVRTRDATTPIRTCFVVRVFSVLICMMGRVPKRDRRRERKTAMLARMTVAAAMVFSAPAFAQDVPGIEICTVDKTMERRTSCLQSNVEFLVKTINKLRSDHEQKLDAANRQIAALRASVTELQTVLAEIKASKPVVKDPVKDAPAGKDGAKQNENTK